MKLEIPQQLIPLAQHVRSGRYRHIITRGGRGSGKSWSIARILAANCMAHGLDILCLRESQKSIKLSSKKLLSKQIEAMGLGAAFDLQEQQILMRNGKLKGEIQFAGLKEHTSDSFKSYEDFDIGWVEEASTVTSESANKLIPTIRKPGSLIVWSYNPDQEDDFVHQLAASGRDDVLVIDCNWEHNPWFPQELETERLALQRINTDLYNHVWGGQCRSAAGLMFKRDWFKFYDVLPSHLNHYIASDYAVTPDGGDFTEHGVFGMADTGDMYVVDWWSGQTDPSVWIDAWIDLVGKYHPLACFEESGVILRAVTGSIDRRMRETGIFGNRMSLPSAGSKAERALGFAARASAGAVYLPKGQMGLRILNQLCAFNGEDGRQDDAVDVCSLVGRGIAQMVGGGSPLADEGERKHGRDYGVHDEEDREDDWKVL